MSHTWNITLVSELAGPADEGMRVWSKHYVAAMRSAGHSVAELVLAGSPRRAAADPRNLARLRASRPDVIQYVPYSGLTPASLLRLRLLGLAVPKAARSIAVLQSARAGLSAPPGLAASVALFASERLRAATGRIAETSVVVYPIVDTTRFAPAPVDRAAVRRELGVPGDLPLVLHVGHLKRSRGLDILGTLAESRELSVLVIASTSTEADPEVRRRLEARGVRVVRRYLPDIERAYRAADVYVFPVEDPLGSIEAPLSVIEAVASGLPVVSTPFGALPELFARDRGVSFARPDAFASRRGDGRRSRPGRRSRRPLRMLRGALRRRRRGRAGLHPERATLVVLSGVDGAGKSTQIALLRDHLAGRGMTVATLWCRWDPLLAKPAVALLGLLARLRRPRRAGAAPAADVRRSIRARILRHRAAWLAWRALMVVDYGMRLAPAVRRARRLNDVVLLDRYWHDVMVDFSFGGPLHEPPALLLRLLPEAQGIVILDRARGGRARTRRRDSRRAYLSERRRLYREAAERYDAVIVDAAPRLARSSGRCPRRSTASCRGCRSAADRLMGRAA